MVGIQIIVAGVGVIAGVVAGILAIWASRIKVPNNIDTFIDALRRAGQLNSYAAIAAAFAALCALAVFIIRAERKFVLLRGLDISRGERTHDRNRCKSQKFHSKAHIQSLLDCSLIIL